jgi:CubicO group peptidase (beta-lactamase class C family)
MAKLGAMMANRGKAIVEGEPDLFTKESTYKEATTYIGAEEDAVFPQILFINQRGGFMVFPNENFFELSDNSTNFVGGAGAGGSLLAWNEKYNIAIAYAMNGYSNAIGPDFRIISIVRSVFDLVKKQKS